MFKKVYEALQENGFSVYSIGQHKGNCTEPYLVVRENGVRAFSSLPVNFELIDVVVFYPVGRYTEVWDFINSVRECLKGVSELKSKGELTALLIDHDVKAYTCSVRYQVYRRRG